MTGNQGTGQNALGRYASYRVARLSWATVLHVLAVLQTLDASFQTGKTFVATRFCLQHLAEHAEDHGIAGFQIVDIPLYVGHTAAELRHLVLELFQDFEDNIGRWCGPLGHRVSLYKKG